MYHINSDKKSNELPLLMTLQHDRELFEKGYHYPGFHGLGLALITVQLPLAPCLIGKGGENE